MPVSDAIKGIGGLSSATETLSVVRVVDIILDETHPEFINLGGWDSLGTIFYIGVNDQKNKLGNVSDDNNLKAKPLPSGPVPPRNPIFNLIFLSILLIY